MTPLTTTAVALDGDWSAFALRGQLTETGGVGRISIHHRESAGGWTRLAWLSRGSTIPLLTPDGFGYCLELAGEWLMVGAPLSDEAGLNAGAVLVYRRQEDNGIFSYTLSQTLLPPATGGAQNFGSAVAVEDGWLVVGADRVPGAVPQAGAAYAFRLNGGSWDYQRQLPSPPSGFRRFGSSLALWRGRALVGSQVSPEPVPPGQRIRVVPLEALPDSYTAWAVSHGLAGTRFGPEVDADEDSLPNLVEFAGDSDPTEPAGDAVPGVHSGLPHLRSVTGGGWEVEFDRRRDPALESQLELSTDGSNWHPPAAAPTTVDLDAAWQRVTLALPGADVQLCRVKYALAD